MKTCNSNNVGKFSWPGIFRKLAKTCEAKHGDSIEPDRDPIRESWNSLFLIEEILSDAIDTYLVCLCVLETFFSLSLQGPSLKLILTPKPISNDLHLQIE